MWADACLKNKPSNTVKDSVDPSFKYEPFTKRQTFQQFFNRNQILRLNRNYPSPPGRNELCVLKEPAFFHESLYLILKMKGRLNFIAKPLLRI